ncbi:PREDICTED: probable serine/threonine-protein kinase NAK [Camelina sativa]|uniref:Probable serine/threonine-protein kinase NAK n=1 Tax=Camelina sativa TaxID=90675 RepID=A0ABM0WJ30_CAMSA|nr:PREDICTED: probable serine/threonine-protein kinase NAK [Camelina sativa]
MGNICLGSGSSTVQQEQSPIPTKPLPVRHGQQHPENKKLPPALVAMPALNPKVPMPETGNRTRSAATPPREKPQQRTRSVENSHPPREKPQERSRPDDDQPSKPAAEKNVLGIGKKAVPPSGKIVTPNLKMFTLVELKTATKNFRPESVIGEGGFGQVFKGWVDDKTLAPSRAGVGIPVAVKKSNPDSEQGLHEWQCEVRFLGKFHHPNLVKLLGYCWEENQFLLVYEYLPKGSLENHLFAKGAEALPWDTRLKIAIEAAQGLTFLHNSEKSVIYRDFKASNILLDSNFHAKLSDFGLAKLGPINGFSHVTTRVVGTRGYAAPEYMATGHLYVRSDVYGFGVVLLELLTGLRALDPNRPSAQQNLVEWAKPVLTQKKKLQKMMDPRLEHKYPLLAVVKTAELILRCLEADPKNRPPMDDVLRELEIVRTIRDQPKEERRKRSSGSDTNRVRGNDSSHGRRTGRNG